MNTTNQFVRIGIKAWGYSIMEAKNIEYSFTETSILKKQFNTKWMKAKHNRLIKMGYSNAIIGVIN